MTVAKKSNHRAVNLIFQSGRWSPESSRLCRLRYTGIPFEATSQISWTNRWISNHPEHDQWPFWIQNLPSRFWSCSKSHKTRCFCSRLKAVCWWLCWCTLGVVAIATGLAQENLYSRRARRRQQKKTTWWSRSWNFSTFMELKLTKRGFLVDYIIHMLTMTISYYIIIRLPYVTIQSHGSSPLQTVFFLCVGLLMSSQGVGVMVFKEIKPQQRW